MSRPIRILLSAVFLASALGFAGCVGTIYDRTYSYQKTHYRSDLEDKKEGSAETILSSIDQSRANQGTPGVDAGAAPPENVPGLPPAGVPAPGGLPEPGAPAAPAVPPPAQ